ncbi:hypothetical protein SLE2022_085170 [Rubroshorea leprosula]
MSLRCYSSQRFESVEFLIQSAHQLEVTPVVKYTALSFFADRFLPRLIQANDVGNWLLQPMGGGNLQLFALISVWISSKIHDSHPVLLKSLKSLGDMFITEQHFTTRDFLEAELVLLQVLNFDIGTSNVAFMFLEELFVRFKGVAKVGELMSFEACMDLMDLLYEKEETSILFCSPCSLAASILVSSYVVTVPKQQWEFPVLPWVKFVTSCKEEDIVKQVKEILKHVFHPSC